MPSVHPGDICEANWLVYRSYIPFVHRLEYGYCLGARVLLLPIGGEYTVVDGDSNVSATHLAQKASSAKLLLGNINSLVFDFVARQKVGGTHLAFFIFRQLPILSPESYTPQDIEFISSRVLELVYTAWDMKPFAQDMGYQGAPFVWNPERRALLRAELDAKYAKLYDLTRDELRYILDPSDVYGAEFPSETFRVLKNKELKEHGEYRTQRLVLAAWDLLESGKPMPSEV
jgi:hypothetical protein